MFFVSFKDNYADEFDVFGFSIYLTKEAFLLDLYKSWLFNYLESGKCPEVEGYLELYDLEIDDYLEKVTLSELESLIDDSNKFYEENEFYKCEFCFGTNEALTYDSFKDFKECFEIKEITTEEYETIKKIIGPVYGIFPISY